MSRSILVTLGVTVVAVVLVLVGCSGGGSSSPTGFVNTSVSDPPTCSAPSGPYSHVFVTVTDVKIHSSSNAGANDSGWIQPVGFLSQAF
jgi:hypothetical protein